MASDVENQMHDELDDQKTLIYGSVSETMLSPEELRKALGLPAGDRIQDYDKLATIGIGGMGAVFSAHEPGLNREVALKILRPQYRNQAQRIEWFIREARATAQIDHPNIPPVHRMGVFDDVGVYFTMKRVEGETLRTILKKLSEDRIGYRRTYTLHRMLEIFIGACNGVAFAHSHGILHCDIKPANLMVGDYGEVLVMDWGMAQYCAEMDQAGNHTKMELDLECELDSASAPEATPGTVLGGTPAFMPPERLTGEVTEATQAADVYGLGAILYTMLTWKSAPFDVGLTSAELKSRVVAGRFPLPRRAAPRDQKVPQELEAICLKAMSRNLSERYATVSDLLSDVRNYLDGYPVSAYSPTALYSLMKLIRRRPLVPATLMAAVLTWSGYYGVTHISKLWQSTSLIDLAETNYSQAKNYNAMAIQQYNLLKERPRENMGTNRERNLESEFFRLTAEQENGYYSALEFISRAPDYGLREDAVNQICRDIFKSSLNLYLKSENYEALESFLRQTRLRWNALFVKAVEQDPELAALVRKINERAGTLEVTGNFQPGRQLTIRNRNGEVIHLKSADPEDVGRTALLLTVENEYQAFELTAGFYNLEILSPSGYVIHAPVEVPLARSTAIDVSLPEEIPPGVALVPGGEFFFGEFSGRLGVGKTSLPAFMIGTHEVTFREYLEFWHSLESTELRDAYAGWYTPDPDSGYRQRIWDNQGTLRPPFRPDLPVVGISGQAAEAYCAWLGKRLGMHCRLPNRLEWEKAARGVDGRTYAWGNIYLEGNALLADNPKLTQYPCGAPPGSFPYDVSGYGVYDLIGNVRELLDTPGEGDRLYMVIGGSYRTDPEQYNTSGINFVRGGADDVGFRYVLVHPEPSTSPFRF